jgi:acyl phosphate:glycerol-3-phosphate acyltransferase
MALAVGYMLGSVPFGLIFSWLAGAGDLRRIGSGNIGATNVLRTGKRGAAVATLFCDAAKGAVAAAVAQRYGTEAAVAAGVGAFLGHVFPVWLKFNGGKGVATFLGIVAAFDWRVGLLTAATWLVMAATLRISSFSALVAAAATPVYFLLAGYPAFAFATACLALMIFLTHRANIVRLVNGNEPRIGQERSVPNR